MSKEEKKLTLEELQKRINDVKELADKSRDQIEELVKRRPLVSSSMIFFVGLMLGVLIGAAVTKRR